MNRIGWIFLTLFLLGGTLFAAVLNFGGTGASTTAGVPVPRAPAVIVQEPGAFLVPVAGVTRAALVNSWGDVRGGGTRSHQGLDIMAPRGTPVLASTTGRIAKLFVSQAGGNAIYLRTPGAVQYYAHLEGYANGLAEGRVVRAGETIGFVGDSGNAGAGNTHLHFAINRLRPGDRWYGGEPVNPYPLLVRGNPGG